MSLIPAGTTVTVKTKYFPPLVVEIGGPATPPGWITKLLRPQVVVAVNGTPISTTTPAGSPDPNVWPTTKIVLAAVVGLAVFGVLRVLK